MFFFVLRLFFCFVLFECPRDGTCRTSCWNFSVSFFIFSFLLVFCVCNFFLLPVCFLSIQKWKHLSQRKTITLMYPILPNTQWIEIYVSKEAAFFFFALDAGTLQAYAILLSTKQWIVWRNTFATLRFNVYHYNLDTVSFSLFFFQCKPIAICVLYASLCNFIKPLDF